MRSKPPRASSFTLAADELCVTHGAISRHVQQLEAWLGRPLFERHNRRVELTDSGRAYLAEVGASFDRIALATAQHFGHAQQRVLRVSAPATFSLRWLVPKLSSFQVAHPAIEVRLSTSNEPIDKLRDKVDLIVRGGPQAIDGYVAEEFLSEVRLPVCAPKLLEGRSLHTPADLAGFTLLHAATYPGMWPEWLAAAGQPNLVPRHSLTLEHFYLTLQGALDGNRRRDGTDRARRGRHRRRSAGTAVQRTGTAAVALLHVRGLGTRERRRGAGIQGLVEGGGKYGRAGRAELTASVCGARAPRHTGMRNK